MWLMFDIISVVLFCWLVIMLARRFMVRNNNFIDARNIVSMFIRQLTVQDSTIKIESVTAEKILFQHAGVECVVQFGQLLLRCAEIPSRTGEIIRLAVEDIILALRQHDVEIADWRETVVPMLYHREQPIPTDIIRDSFVDDLNIVYVLSFPNYFRYLTEKDRHEFAVEREELHELALRNLERSCNRLEIDTPGPDSEGYERMLRFTTGDGLDASRLLIPSFFQRFSPRFDNTDLLVTIPTRDTLVMFSERDATLAKMLSLRNSAEMNNRAYPLYPKIMLVNEDAISAWYP